MTDTLGKRVLSILATLLVLLALAGFGQSTYAAETQENTQRTAVVPDDTSDPLSLPYLTDAQLPQPQASATVATPPTSHYREPDYAVPLRPPCA